MIKNSPYNDIILYAKGWYQRKDLFEDLNHLIEQVYGWRPETKKDTAMRMLCVLDSICESLRTDGQVLNEYRWYTSHSRFEGEIEHLVTFYNITREVAIIRIVLSILLGITHNEIQLNKPVFGKKHYFRLGHIGNDYPISMTYAEMNKIASKFFDKFNS